MICYFIIRYFRSLVIGSRSKDTFLVHTQDENYTSEVQEKNVEFVEDNTDMVYLSIEA